MCVCVYLRCRYCSCSQVLLTACCVSQASLLFVDSAQYLFYTVALDTRDEAAACSLILSARLSHPLATVEVLVRDVQVWLRKNKKTAD